MQTPDCKQVCIALVVTREGMPVGYEVFDGNREEIVATMETRHGEANRVWVMDDTRPATLCLEWSSRPEWDEWAQHSEGCYVLRTNVSDWTAEDLRIPVPIHKV